MRSSAKYSRLEENEVLDPDEPTFDFNSHFNYNDNLEAGYDIKNNYDSAFTYRDTGVKVRSRGIDGSLIDPPSLGATAASAAAGKGPALWLVATSWILTALSYIFFLLTIPVSYWLLVKKLGEFERLVIFRLGKMIGVKGPGRFVVFPWMDRTKRIDVRAAAFAVPPQQFITVDGGIVEMGAEIQYGIVDVVTMISEVADHQDILRSLGKTLLVKILVKKTVHQLDRDKRTPESEILDDLNDQVRKWGINVQSVSLSEIKILKQPESGSNQAVGSILKGLGVKGESKYPSPQEFVRSVHGLGPDESQYQLQQTVSLIGGAISNTVAGALGGSTSVNLSLLQSLSVPGATVMGQGIVVTPSVTPADEYPANWGRCLETIINSEFGGYVEEDAHGTYRLEITETNQGKDVYYIEISTTKRCVGTENKSGRDPDVSVSISSSDLGNVLDGSLAPLQAYLTGRISASGDVRKLMFFDKLSRRGHKQGTMFSV